MSANDVAISDASCISVNYMSLNFIIATTGATKVHSGEPRA